MGWVKRMNADDSKWWKRATRIPINWFIVLTMPAWGGLLLFGALAYAILSGSPQATQIASGRKWVWEG